MENKNFMFRKLIEHYKKYWPTYLYLRYYKLALIAGRLLSYVNEQDCFQLLF